ncbi:hypothetical protein DV738_g2895, partial [Chaetothyriales sp. CBS 135597]
MSSPIPSPHGVFSDEEVEALERDLIFERGIPIKGKRKVSSTFLTLPDIILAGSFPGPSTTSSLSIRFDTSESRLSPSPFSFDLPVDPVSIEALEFIGFTTPTATEIYDRYVSRPDPMENFYDLLEYAYGHVERLQGPAYRALPPRQAVEAVGLDKITQDTLLDPYFSDIFSTQDLCYWIKDTLKMRYVTLQQLQDRLKAQAAAIIQEAKKKDTERASLKDDCPHVADNIQQQVASQAINAVISMTFDTLPSNQITIVTEEPDATIPGHTTLYNGKGVSELIGNGPWIAEDGNLEMGCLANRPGGDFSFDVLAHYWTCNKAVAEKYRLWAARRDCMNQSVIIRIQVPDTFLASLNTQELWYSPDWKEFVWLCRKLRRPPAKFQHLLNAELIRGHICQGMGQVITNIDQHNVQTRISEDHIMRVPETNEKAKQFAFISSDVYYRLGDAVRGKLFVDVSRSFQSFDK